MINYYVANKPASSNTPRGRAAAQAVSRRLPRFEPASSHVASVVNKGTLEQVFFSSISVSLAKHSTDCSIFITIHHHPRLVQ
jgi:hypothetical protein